MTDADQERRSGLLHERGLLIGRGTGWGILGGAALGALSWTVLCVEAIGFRSMAFIGVPVFIGAVLGACLGLAAGLALALSSRQVIRRIFMAQLITGSTVTAVLLTAAYLSPLDTLWGFFYRLSPIDLTVVAALTAVLLTPRIVTGASDRREGERRPGRTEGRSGTVRCFGAAR